MLSCAVPVRPTVTFAAPCNVTRRWNDMTLNSWGGSTLKCDTWLWDDITYNLPGGRNVQCDKWMWNEMTLNSVWLCGHIGDFGTKGCTVRTVFTLKLHQWGAILPKHQRRGIVIAVGVLVNSCHSKFCYWRSFEMTLSSKCDLKKGLGVVQDHWKWRRSIDYIRLSTGPPL